MAGEHKVDALRPAIGGCRRLSPGPPDLGVGKTRSQGSGIEDVCQVEQSLKSGRDEELNRPSLFPRVFNPLVHPHREVPLAEGPAGGRDATGLIPPPLPCPARVSPASFALLGPSGCWPVGFSLGRGLRLVLWGDAQARGAPRPLPAAPGALCTRRAGWLSGRPRGSQPCPEGPPWLELGFCSRGARASPWGRSP